MVEEQKVEKAKAKAEIEVERRVEVEADVEVQGGAGVVTKGRGVYLEKKIVKEKIIGEGEVKVQQHMKEKENNNGIKDVGIEAERNIDDNSKNKQENNLKFEKLVSGTSVKMEGNIETKIEKTNSNEERTSRSKNIYENNGNKFLHERNEDKIDQDYLRIDNINNNSVLLNAQRKEREENEIRIQYLDLFTIMS